MPLTVKNEANKIEVPQICLKFMSHFIKTQTSLYVSVKGPWHAQNDTQKPTLVQV